MAPQYRRKGIGQSVVQHAENKLHKEASKIMTKFHADNEVPKRFARTWYRGKICYVFMQRNI